MDERHTTMARSEIKAIAHDRGAISAHFEEIPKLVLATQEEIAELKNRGLLKRIFSNNTRDLANAMGHVVQIQQFTLSFAMILIELHNRDVGMLRFLREQIGRTQAELGMAVAHAGETSSEIVAVQQTLDQVLDLVDTKITKAGGGRLPWSYVVAIAAALAVVGIFLWLKVSGPK